MANIEIWKRIFAVFELATKLGIFFQYFKIYLIKTGLVIDPLGQPKVRPAVKIYLIGSILKMDTYGRRLWK